MTADPCRWVVLEPLDTVAVRDGRAFDAGQQSVAHAALPSPATVAGAIGAAYDPTPGLAHTDPTARGTRLPKELHGPVVAYEEGDRWLALLPVPYDVVVAPDGQDSQDGEALRLVVDDSEFRGVGHDLDGEVTTLLRESVADSASAEAHWWDADQLQDYLHDGVPSSYWVEAPWQVERRVGLARAEADRSVADGMLYSIEHLRLRHGIGFAARCVGGPDRKLDGTVAFGGQGRRAELHANVPAIELPDHPDDFPDGRLLLYLLTPAVFPEGRWRPDVAAWESRWGAVELVAAAVGPPRVISSIVADRQTGGVRAGRLLWAAPPGSVYYLAFRDAATALKAAGTLHGACLPQAEDWMRTAGFGLALTGRWWRG